VAGSPGMLGAAHLACLGALASGAGLITAYVPSALHLTAMSALPPEVMVRSWREIGPARADAWGVGPGLGPLREDALWEWARGCPEPMVWDADFLNWLAAHGAEATDFAAGPRLLTPHPGEMRRLWPDSVHLSRARGAAELAAAWPMTLLAKSSRTLVAQDGQPVVYNSTGTPAMASGGMGDVLTGFLTGLIAQGLELRDAAICGSWCLGVAGENVALQRGVHALRASLVAKQLSQELADVLAN
jgi:ADP-dependent NAD(P)H-hydrate dehydratase / NAD(P)H-hydrate epimerase